jgi:hypothetical protein
LRVVEGFRVGLGPWVVKELQGGHGKDWWRDNEFERDAREKQDMMPTFISPTRTFLYAELVLT